MIITLWLFPVTTVITGSSVKPLTLFSVYFKPFLAPKSRGDERKTDGTGLGLAISKELIEVL